MASSNASNSSDTEESKGQATAATGKGPTPLVIDCREAATLKRQAAPKLQAQQVNVPLEVLDEVDRLIKRFKKK